MSSTKYLSYPAGYSPEDIMAAAETFLDGGTDYETPLNESMQLMTREKESFSKAEIVFITDGECSISQSFLDSYKKNKKTVKFRTIGILLDRGSGSFNIGSLKTFCDVIYRTSEMDDDGIARAVISSSV